MKKRIVSAALTLLFSLLYFCCFSGLSDLLFRRIDPHSIANLIAAFLLLMALIASVCLGMYSSKKLMKRFERYR